MSSSGASNAAASSAAASGQNTKSVPGAKATTVAPTGSVTQPAQKAKPQGKSFNVSYRAPEGAQVSTSWIINRGKDTHPHPLLADSRSVAEVDLGDLIAKATKQLDKPVVVIDVGGGVGSAFRMEAQLRRHNAESLVWTLRPEIDPSDAKRCLDFVRSGRTTYCRHTLEDNCECWKSHEINGVPLDDSHVLACAVSVHSLYYMQQPESVTSWLNLIHQSFLRAAFHTVHPFIETDVSGKFGEGIYDVVGGQVTFRIPGSIKVYRHPMLLADDCGFMPSSQPLRTIGADQIQSGVAIELERPVTIKGQTVVNTVVMVATQKKVEPPQQVAVVVPAPVMVETGMVTDVPRADPETEPDQPQAAVEQASAEEPDLGPFTLYRSSGGHRSPIYGYHLQPTASGVVLHVVGNGSTSLLSGCSRGAVEGSCNLTELEKRVYSTHDFGKYVAPDDRATQLKNRIQSSFSYVTVDLKGSVLMLAPVCFTLLYRKLTESLIQVAADDVAVVASEPKEILSPSSADIKQAKKRFKYRVTGWLADFWFKFLNAIWLPIVVGICVMAGMYLGATLLSEKVVYPKCQAHCTQPIRLPDYMVPAFYQKTPWQQLVAERSAQRTAKLLKVASAVHGWFTHFAVVGFLALWSYVNRANRRRLALIGCCLALWIQLTLLSWTQEPVSTVKRTHFSAHAAVVSPVAPPVIDLAIPAPAHYTMTLTDMLPLAVVFCVYILLATAISVLYLALAKTCRLVVSRWRMFALVLIAWMAYGTLSAEANTMLSAATEQTSAVLSALLAALPVAVAEALRRRVVRLNQVRRTKALCVSRRVNARRDTRDIIGQEKANRSLRFKLRRVPELVEEKEKMGAIGGVGGVMVQGVEFIPVVGGNTMANQLAGVSDRISKRQIDMGRNGRSDTLERNFTELREFLEEAGVMEYLKEVELPDPWVEEWWNKQKPSKQRKMLPDVIRMFGSLDIYLRKRCSEIEYTMSADEWSETLQTELFVKRETTIKTEDTFKPRVIQNPTPSSKILFGPHAYRADLWMKKRFGPTQPVTYAGGLNGEKVGDYVDRAVNDLGHCYVLENDMSKFEGSITAEALEFESWVWQELGSAPFMAEFMRRDMQQSGNGTRRTFLYSLLGGRKSGRNNTSCGNSLLNALVTIYTICMLIEAPDRKTRFEVFRRMVRSLFMGDDNILFLSRLISKLGHVAFKDAFCQGFKNFFADFGFDAVLKINDDISQATFCGCTFVHTESGVMPAPSVPRQMLKMTWATSVPGKPVRGYMRWLAQVVRQTGPAVSHVPILRTYLAKLATLVPDVEAAPVEYKPWCEERHTLTSRGMLDFCDYYGLTLMDVRTIEQTIAEWDVTEPLHCPLLSEICERFAELPDGYITPQTTVVQ